MHPQLTRIRKANKVEPLDNEGFSEHAAREKANNAKIRPQLVELVKAIQDSPETLPWRIGIFLDISLIDDPLYGGNPDEGVMKTVFALGNQPYRRLFDGVELFGWTHGDFFGKDPRLSRIPGEDLSEGGVIYTGTNLPIYLSVIEQLLREYETLEHGSIDTQTKKTVGSYYGDDIFNHITEYVQFAFDQKIIKPWLLATIPILKTHSLAGKMLYHAGQNRAAMQELSMALADYQQKGWQTNDIDNYLFAIRNEELLFRNPALRRGLPGKVFPVGWHPPKDKKVQSFVMADFNEDGLLDEAILLTNKDTKLNSGMAVFVYFSQADKKYRVQKITTTDLNHKKDRVYELFLQKGEHRNVPVRGLGAYVVCPDESCYHGEFVEMRWSQTKQKMVYFDPEAILDEPAPAAPPTPVPTSPVRPAVTTAPVVRNTTQTNWIGGITPEELGKILLKALKTNDQKLWAKTVLPLEIEGDKNEYEKWAEWHRTKRFELLREGLEGNGVTNWDLAVFSRVIYQSYLADDGIKMAKDPVVEFTYKNGEFIGAFNFVVFYRKDGKYYVPGVQPRILSKGSLYRNIK